MSYGGFIKMSIEPQDIQQKQFSNKMRGYNPVEVDEFLDEVAFEQRRLHDEIDTLRSQLNEAKSRIDYFDEMKESLNKSIMVAQDAADKVKISSRREAEFTSKEAQKEAKSVIDAAHKKADSYIGEAAGKAQKVVIATDDLKKQARSFRQKFEVLLESQLQMIKGRDWDNLLSSDELLTIGEIKEAMRNSGTLDNFQDESVHSEEVVEVTPDTPAVEPEVQDDQQTVVVFPEDYNNENGNPTSEGFHVKPKE